MVCWIRFLDKAAIPQEYIKPQPWKVCTVTQVEEVKILTRMLPIVASTIIMNTCLAQLQTFSVQQGNVMNLKLGSFTVPASSIPVIPLIFISILVPIYELFFVPFARKITNHPSGITQLQRVGVGLVLSVISMTVAGIVEVKRRDQSRKDPSNPISLFWLSFQYGIFGIADMFTLVGLLEFFYRESPSSMKSLSTSFTWLSMSIGYFLSTVFVNLINVVTKRITPSKQGWLHGFDLNQSNLNLFYWFLAILSCLNFFNYLYWASRYKYKSEDQNSSPIGLKSLHEMPLKMIGGTKQNWEGSIGGHTQDWRYWKHRVETRMEWISGCFGLIILNRITMRLLLCTKLLIVVDVCFIVHVCLYDWFAIVGSGLMLILCSDFKGLLFWLVLIVIIR